MATTATETKQPPTTPDTTKKRVTLTQRDARLGLWLMSPTLLVVLAIVIFPLLWSILLSFQRMRLIQIGRADFFEPLTLANYERVLGSSNFLVEPGRSPSSTPSARWCWPISLGVLAAMALRQPFRGRNFVRAAYLLPYVAPVVAVTFIWRTMLNPQFGIVNVIGQNVLAGTSRSPSCRRRREPGTCSGWRSRCPRRC